MLLWVKCKNGSYIRFPREQLQTFSGGRLGTLRNPAHSSVWLDFANLTGRSVWDYFDYTMTHSPTYGWRYVLKSELQ